MSIKIEKFEKFALDVEIELGIDYNFLLKLCIQSINIPQKTTPNSISTYQDEISKY